MQNRALLKQVKMASKFKTPEDVKVFDEGVWELVKQPDEALFTELLNLFDDNTVHPEVMYSLVHALESLPDEFYVSNILRNIPNGLKKCEEWYSGLFIAALNNQNCLTIIRKKLRNICDIELNNLVASINKLSPYHAELIQELRRELNK